MNILESSLRNLRVKLDISIQDPEYHKFQHLVTVVNQAYLKIALNEFEQIKQNNPFKTIDSNFDLLLSLYNKHLKEHQVMFLLFNIFETAMRSKIAVELSSKYSSQGEDNWLHDDTLRPTKITRPFNEASQKIQQDGDNITQLTSFDIFDYITLGQLKNIYLDFWGDLSSIFQAKTKNSFEVPQLSKRRFKMMFENIRKARNDNAHHKPFHTSRLRRHQIIENIELLLVHIGFNLQDAINNIDPSHNIVHLHYSQ
jgi:hypothetical protein